MVAQVIYITFDIKDYGVLFNAADDSNNEDVH